MSAAQYLLAGVACPFLAGVVALGWLRYTAPSRRRRRASKRLIVAITADTSRFAAAMRIAAARMGVAMAEADASLRRFSVAVQRLGDWGVPAWQGSFPPAWVREVRADMAAERLSTSAVARIMGLDRGTISRWLELKVRPSDAKLRALAILLGQPEHKYTDLRRRA